MPLRQAIGPAAPSHHLISLWKDVHSHLAAKPPSPRGWFPLSVRPSRLCRTRSSFVRLLPPLPHPIHPAAAALGRELFLASDNCHTSPHETKIINCSIPDSTALSRKQRPPNTPRPFPGFPAEKRYPGQSGQPDIA